jgi:hypothetical protein
MLADGSGRFVGITLFSGTPLLRDSFFSYCVDPACSKLFCLLSTKKQL